MIKQSKWLDKHCSEQKGKTYVVTGASSGLGLECARSLAYLGAKVYLAIRNPSKGEKAMESIKEDIPNADLSSLVYDQADGDSIVKMAESIKDTHIDGFVLNAGIYYPKKDERCEDGTGITFHTNARGAYRVFNAFKENHKDSRFVFVTSPYVNRPHGGYQNYIGHAPDKRGREYSVSKQYQKDLFAFALREGYDVSMSHPGVSGTSIFDNFPPLIRKLGHKVLYVFVHKPWKACLGEVIAVTESSSKGKFFVPRGPFHISGYPKAIKAPKLRDDPTLK